MLHNPSLPLWVLTPREEKEVMAEWKKNAYAQCDLHVRAFSACAEREGAKVGVNCKNLFNDMSNCILLYNNAAEFDLARTRYIDAKIRRLEAEVAARKQ